MAQKNNKQKTVADAAKLTLLAGTGIWLMQMLMSGAGQQAVQVVQKCCGK